MKTTPVKINPKKVLFIKLGAAGKYEKESIVKGLLTIGFKEFNHEDLLSKRWDVVRKVYKDAKVSAQWISNYENQIRNFYELDTSVLWITFYNQKMWWGFASEEFIGNGNEPKSRILISGWNSKNIYGDELLVDNLSGQLTQVQAYRSTICKVKAARYAVMKINGEELPEVLEVRKDIVNLKNHIAPLIRKLTPGDFEILVDLIFRYLGCQRTGIVGKTQKIKDIELYSPLSHERYLVQVKSQSNLVQFKEYETHFETMIGYDRYYYVVHTPSGELENYKSKNRNILIWKIDELTEFTINAGLVKWLMNKVG